MDFLSSISKEPKKGDRDEDKYMGTDDHPGQHHPGFWCGKKLGRGDARGGMRHGQDWWFGGRKLVRAWARNSLEKRDSSEKASQMESPNGKYEEETGVERV